MKRDEGEHLISLTSGELSALIEACNVIGPAISSSRPPWCWYGTDVRTKLIEAKKEGPDKFSPVPRRQMRILMRNMSREVAAYIGKLSEENEAKVIRTSGDAICLKCHLELRNHLEIQTGLVLTCDGRLCKL